MVNIENVVRVVTGEQKPKGRSHEKSTAQQAQQVQRPCGALFPLSVAQQRNYVPSRMIGMAAAVCGAEGRHIGIRTWAGYRCLNNGMMAELGLWRMIG